MHLTLTAVLLRSTMLNCDNAVPGSGLPEATHPSTAAGAAQLHAPVQATQAHALPQGMQRHMCYILQQHKSA